MLSVIITNARRLALREIESAKNDAKKSASIITVVSDSKKIEWLIEAMKDSQMRLDTVERELVSALSDIIELKKNVHGYF